VIIDVPKHVYRWPAFRCMGWFNRLNPICIYGPTMERELLLSHRASIMDSIRALSRHSPQLWVWEPFPILCDTAPCSAFDRDKPLLDYSRNSAGSASEPPPGASCPQGHHTGTTPWHRTRSSSRRV
jgi:hypothetical protein